MSRISFFLLLFVSSNVKAGLFDPFIVTVAVVEYQSVHDSKMTPQEHLKATVADYVEILRSISDPKLDMIVYPEATLDAGWTASNVLEYSTYVKFGENPCEEPEEYSTFMKDLSCVAKERNIYVVISTIEKEKCPTGAVYFQNCKRYGFGLYRTNVIFDNNGTIAGWYRKANLFGEDVLDEALVDSETYFSMKWRCTFGILDSFDILLRNPTQKLLDLNVKHFLFPADWSAELPFLTSLQTQQMWAQEHEVNIYSAGTNDPKTGRGGSGIINGTFGLISGGIVAQGGSKTFTYKFSTIDLPTSPFSESKKINEVDALAEEMDEFKLGIDNSLSRYTNKILDLKSPHTETSVCTGNNQLCCNFDIKLTTNTSVKAPNSYTYFMVAFNGIRQFFGAKNLGFEVCGLIACLDSSFSSCGRTFPDYKDVGWPTTFEEITITANFSDNGNTTQFPNSLLSSIRPISPREISWTKREIEGIGPGGRVAAQVERTLALTEPQNRLLTFAIFGRNFGSDSVVTTSKPDSANQNTFNVFVYSFVMLLTLFVIA